MADVKLGTKTFSGVTAVKLNTVDGGTVTFPDKEETSGGAVSGIHGTFAIAATYADMSALATKKE